MAVVSGDRWLLQASITYFHHAEMNVEESYCTPGLRFYQWMMEKNRKARLVNQRRLRELAHRHADDITVCCSHDPMEFERLTSSARGDAGATA